MSRVVKNFQQPLKTLGLLVSSFALVLALAPVNRVEAVGTDSGLWVFKVKFSEPTCSDNKVTAKVLFKRGSQKPVTIELRDIRVDETLDKKKIEKGETKKLVDQAGPAEGDTVPYIVLASDADTEPYPVAYKEITAPECN